MGILYIDVNALLWYGTVSARLVARSELGPAVGSTTFDHSCAVLNGDTPTVKDTAHMVHLPGGLNVNLTLLNYAKVCALPS